MRFLSALRKMSFIWDEGKSNSNELEAKQLSFRDAVEHLHRGYENTQQVIRLLDAKAGVVIALSSGVFVFVGKLLLSLEPRFVKNVDFSGGCCTLGLMFSGIVLLAGLVVTGLFCIHQTCGAVRPNGLPNKMGFVSLFPLHNSSSDEKERAVHYFQQFSKGGNEQLILAEYESQLMAMGGLIHKKAVYLGRAITLFLWQAALTGAFVGFTVILVLIGLLPK